MYIWELKYNTMISIIFGCLIGNIITIAAVAAIGYYYYKKKGIESVSVEIEDSNSKETESNDA